MYAHLNGGTPRLLAVHAIPAAGLHGLTGVHVCRLHSAAQLGLPVSGVGVINSAAGRQLHPCTGDYACLWACPCTCSCTGGLLCWPCHAVGCGDVAVPHKGCWPAVLRRGALQHASIALRAARDVAGRMGLLLAYLS